MKFLKNIINIIRTFFNKPAIPANSCKTKYPILLVHGIAYRDDMAIPSWGKVPDYLRRGGATVYLADTEAWASYKDNGEKIKNKIEEILKENNTSKVNIIAHSKGGVDSRYAISFYKLDDKVASLTTISSPHRGTCIADIVANNLPEQASFLYDAVDCIGRIMGDKNPQTNQAVKELTRDAMQDFNQKNPDSPNVYYQSYGAEMKNPLNDPLFSATYLIMKNVEGEDDGMISKHSYQWGEFRGTIGSNLPGFGISHSQITGSMMEIIAGENIPLLYMKWVVDLKEKGF